MDKKKMARNGSELVSIGKPSSNPSLGTDDNNNTKPQVPPRMKKRAPAPPPKPPSLGMAKATTITSGSSGSSTSSTSSHPKGQTSSPPSSYSGSLPDLPGSVPSSDHRSTRRSVEEKPNPKREILVAAAASRGSREKMVERRQREPARLLVASPTSLEESEDSDEGSSFDVSNDATSRRTVQDRHRNSSSMPSRKNPTVSVLIPRGHPLLESRSKGQMWASPVSYSMWMQRAGSGDPQIHSGLLRRVFGSNVDLRHPAVARVMPGHHGHRNGTAISHHMPTVRLGKPPAAAPSVPSKQRSSSVTRSGSLTSHGSTSSESGNETFPKSVLKKPRRSNKTNRPEAKKNVTFNAFATVQLMEE